MSKAEAPFAKGRKVCIFCGDTPVTAEHIWPQWARALLPPATKHFRKIINADKKHRTASYERDYNRQGTAATIRISRVCRSCNSGWMGTYEQSVRSLLEPMIKGEYVALDIAGQKLLTEYFTFKTMVADWEASPIVGDSDRSAFYESRTIPKNTQIHLFKCGDGRWRMNLLGQAAGIWPEDTFTHESGYNIKSFTMGFGDLLIATILAPDVIGYPKLRFQPGLSVQIHPALSKMLHWPPLFTINAQTADAVANAVWNLDGYPDFDLGKR